MAKEKGDDIKLSPAQIKKITETASQVACEAYRKEAEVVRQENRDKRLYNTRLLMEKYRGLVKYSEDAVYDASQITEDEELQEVLCLMDPGKDSSILTVESIRERAAKTRIVIQHMNKMLDYYRYTCEKSGKQEIARKWSTVKWLYLDEEEKTVSEIADVFYVDERTVYRYNKAALQDLSALFFGFTEVWDIFR